MVNLSDSTYKVRLVDYMMEFFPNDGINKRNIHDKITQYKTKYKEIRKNEIETTGAGSREIGISAEQSIRKIWHLYYDWDEMVQMSASGRNVVEQAILRNVSHRVVARESTESDSIVEEIRETVIDEDDGEDESNAESCHYIRNGLEHTYEDGISRAIPLVSDDEISGDETYNPQQTTPHRLRRPSGAIAPDRLIWRPPSIPSGRIRASPVFSEFRSTNSDLSTDSARRLRRLRRRRRRRRTESTDTSSVNMPVEGHIDGNMNSYLQKVDDLMTIIQSTADIERDRFPFEKEQVQQQAQQRSMLIEFLTQQKKGGDKKAESRLWAFLT